MDSVCFSGYGLTRLDFQVMDSVFEKLLEDRNEKDIMLLVNYLEKNPFLANIGYARSPSTIYRRIVFTYRWVYSCL